MNTADPFDPETYRLPGAELKALASGPATKPPRHRPGEWFLRGPVPWAWLERAARLPGKTLALSLALWREAGRCSGRSVKLCLARLPLCVGKQAARRALRSLEEVSLVTVRRTAGRSLEVTIQDAPPADRNGQAHEPGTMRKKKRR